jgi:non-ribosomal peptide synthetase component F
VTLGAYAHGEAPFEKLVEELQPERDLSRAPLFQVMLAFQNTPSEPLRLKGLTLTALPTDHFAARFDLLLSLTEADGGITGSLQYRQDLFDAETAERMVEHYQTLLAGAAADPGQRLSRLPMLSERERRQQLEEWNATAPDEGTGEGARAVLEELLEAIWGELLGREVGRERINFFELGGDPLLATRMLGRVREVFGVEVELRELFERPTPGGLAAVIEERIVAEIEQVDEAIVA